MTYASRYKSAQQRSGVFISYARSDGEVFAHRLRQQLEKQNIRLWQDRVGLEGGRDWWSQITEALDADVLLRGLWGNDRGGRSARGLLPAADSVIGICYAN